MYEYDVFHVTCKDNSVSRKTQRDSELINE